MFEFIRNHKRWMQTLLAILIIPSFAIVGIDSYFQDSGNATEVANVGGRKITQVDLEEAQRRQVERYRAGLGAQFDPKMLETPEAKQEVLDSLIAERAIEAEIASSHMTVTDAMLQKSIAAAPEFQKPDGGFDMDQYKAYLTAQRMTAAQLDASIRRDMTLRQINGAIQSSAFAPRSVAARLSDISAQEREVQELIFPVADFASQVKVTDDMVKAYYDKNATLFQVPEQAKAEYLVFDAAAVESLVTVADTEVAEVYGKNVKRYTSAEQRSASHILLLVKADASAADKAAVKAKAEAILADVRKAPDSFADIAKKESQDDVSNQAGGDLGVISTDNVATPLIYETALKLKEGEISNLVESKFGYHIVKLTKLAPSAVKPLDEVKGEITAELKKAKMSKKYTELKEMFTNTLYEQADSLKPAADKLKLQILTADKLGRTPNPALGAAPFNNEKFLKALFSDDTLKNKRNTEAVEVAPSILVAGRVVEYKPAAKRALAEVADVLRARVAQEEASKLAKQAGEAKLLTAKAAADAAGFGAAKVVSRAAEPVINETAALAVLKADTSKLPAYVGVELPGLGYGVYRINKVGQPAAPNPARRDAEREQIANALAQQEVYGYIEALKQKAKTKILVKPDAVAAAK